MFTVLYILILINSILINKLLYKTIIKPNILFNLMWCLGGGIASLGLYEIYKPSVIVHVYAILVLLSFNIIYYLLNSTNTIEKSDINIVGNLRLKLIYFFNILSWIYLASFLLKAINIILNEGGFRVLRMYAFDSSHGLASTQELLIIQIFINAIFTTTIILAAISLVQKKRNYPLILIAIIDILFYTLLFGGRMHILNFVVYYLLAFLIVKFYSKNPKKVRVNTRIIILASISLIVLTSARAWNNHDLFETFVWYFTGGFNNLSVVLETTSDENFLFGKATFGFVINIFLMGLSLIFGLDYNGSDHIITSVTSVMRYISPTIQTNASTTMIYPLIRDFGIFGILLGTSFLAIITSIFEKNFMKTNSLLYFCLYIYVLSILFNSILTYTFLFPATGITILFMLLFIKSSTKSAYTKIIK